MNKGSIKKVVVSSGSNISREKISNDKMLQDPKNKMIKNSINKGR